MTPITITRSAQEYILSIIPDDVELATFEITIPWYAAEQWAADHCRLEIEWEQIAPDQTDVIQGTSTVSAEDYLLTYIRQEELAELIRWSFGQVVGT